MTPCLRRVCLYKQRQGNGDFLLQFHKAVVGNQLGEQVAHVLAYGLQVEVLQAAVAGIMEQYHDEHHLCFRQRGRR